MKNFLAFIHHQDSLKQFENLAFREHLQKQCSTFLDEKVQKLEKKISKTIDCTSCGNCCGQLMINLENSDIESLSDFLKISSCSFKNNYVESSSSGEIQIMNAVPCSFLKNNKCTVYEARPKECRNFPGLNQPQFQQRIFATLMHYGRCPIIYYVMEALKKETGFIYDQ